MQNLQKKGFMMSITVVVSLVVLLVLVSISITIISRDANTFSFKSGSKIDSGSSVTLCQIGCFKCCRYSEDASGLCGTSGDTVFETEECVCSCDSDSF